MFNNLREISTRGVLWARVDSSERIGDPVGDPVGNTRQIAGTGCKPVITEFMTDGKIAQGTREINLPVSNVRRAPEELKKMWYDNIKSIIYS
jgi:hypothetical protein